MRRPLIWMAAGVCAGGLFLLTELHVNDGGAPSAGPPTTDPAIGAVSDAPTSRFAPRPPSLEPEPPHLAAPTMAPTEVPPPESDGELREVLAEQKRERAKLREMLDARLAAESRDSEWAGVVERDLSGSIAKFAELATLERVECRDTLCSLEMSHPNPDDQRQAMNDLAGEPGFRLAGKAHLEFSPEEGARTYVYLRRDSDRFD